MYRPDTSLEAQQIYDGMIRRMTEPERFLRGISLTRFCRSVVFSSLKKQNPTLKPGPLKILFFERLYGSAFRSEEKAAIHAALQKHPTTLGIE